MATLQEHKASLKAANPTLSKMVDNIVIVLDTDEYNATIDEWAQIAYDQEQEEDISENGGASSDYAFYRQRYGYPDLGEQLDMMYKDQINDTTTWRDSITAIKNKYRKP